MQIYHKQIEPLVNLLFIKNIVFLSTVHLKVQESDKSLQIVQVFQLVYHQIKEIAKVQFIRVAPLFQRLT